MIANIRLSTNEKEIAACARMMVDSPPWSSLYFTEKQCRENLASHALELYIAEVANRLVGFVATRPTGIEGEPLIEYMCVDSEYQGQGIGSSMLAFVEQRLYPNADNLYLFVSDINPRAIALYSRVGYARVGELPHYNLFGQTEYLFRKFRRPRQERLRPPGTNELLSKGVSVPGPRGSSLTNQQTEGNNIGAIDLATGYPRFPLPESLAELVIEGTRAAMNVGSVDNDAQVRLRTSFGQLLGIAPELTTHARSTFSGSIALDRVFIAIREHARSVGKSGLCAILPEPCIDLCYLLLKEHPDVLIKGVMPVTGSKASRVDHLIEQLEIETRRSPNRQALVVLDSPSNPLGVVTDAEDLTRLASACGRLKAVLVVDHCFLLAGLHAPTRLPSVFDLSEKICNWIGVWDTGKSIDLYGDKIGFIVPGNPRMTAVVDQALSVIQPDTYVAKRVMEVFSRLLGAPEMRTYLSDGGKVCRSNLKNLQSHILKDWSVPTPSAGTFACMYAPDSEHGSDHLRMDWLSRGVSTAAGRTFFPDTFTFTGEGSPFLRISLLRSPEFFREALRRLPDNSSADKS